MQRWLGPLFCFLYLFTITPVIAQETNSAAITKVYVIPVRGDIEPSMTYIVRRGIKAALDAKAEMVILDMDTNGGRVDTTEDIIEILGQFKGKTVTYVNRKAFSAGAFISFATQDIYMAPQSVIGAAAPILVSPTGGAEGMPDTVEAKMTSALSAMVRTSAEKNGHNAEVAEAMIKKNKELIIDGNVINEKGNLLTLTDREAAAEYGNPPEPLLSAGTVDTLEKLLDILGASKAEMVRIEPTGAEKAGAWLNAIGGILLAVGILAFWIEFKTPGFGLPGAVGIVAFALYFLGGYIAGLSGAEWVLVFLLGLVLIILEFFVFPGTIFLGIAGLGLVAVSIIMAFVDIYPGTPSLPSDSIFRSSLRDSFETFGLSLVIAVGGGLLLARILPKTPMYGTLVSTTTSGLQTELQVEKTRAARFGQEGVALSVLRPGGKAQFGDENLDVISRGEMISKGERVKIVGFSGPDAIVEKVS